MGGEGMPPGFEGMFGNMGGGGGGGGARTFHFTTGGGGRPGGAGFSFSDPNDIFSEFLRGGAGGGMGGMGGGGGGDDDFLNSFMGGGGMPRSSGGRGRTSSSRFGAPRASTPEVTVVERELPVSLEDLFKGTTKKMKIKSKKFGPDGKQQMEDKILEVPIKPGLKAGSKIKYSNVGDQVEGGTQDLHFVVKEVRTDLRSVSSEIYANKHRRRNTHFLSATAMTYGTMSQ